VVVVAGREILKARLVKQFGELCVHGPTLGSSLGLRLLHKREDRSKAHVINLSTSPLCLIARATPCS
jgi:hypothetical protein